MNELTDWSLVQHLVREKLRVARQAVADTELTLACTEACVEVYARFGKPHPSSWGMGSSPRRLREDLIFLRTDLDRWEAALKLVEDAAEVRGTVVDGVRP